MCGILGWVGSEAGDESARARVPAALDALRSRGPNGNQVEAGSDWLLGHTRLKILDLTERAAQPMRDAEGRWIVFNGEIYNFREIRKELEDKGRHFRSTGDTEVLLQALAEWGTSAVAKFDGMFALAWLDPRRRELSLARDRFGVKPLVWEKTADGVRFASNLFALNALAGGAREIDPEAVRDYLLLGYVPAPRCIWRGPRKVMPGSLLQFRWRNDGEVEISSHAFWSMRDVPPAGTSKPDEASEFPEKLRDAVRSRLVSDVPVGLLLSGGVDSSCVAAACAELPKDEADVPAFTMGFADVASDERAFAEGVAKAVGLRQESFLAENENIDQLFTDTWKAFDEPFADSSALPMLLLCREVARRVTVAVGGDGGDEVWCGYPWHRALYRAENLSWIPRLGRKLASVVAGQPNSQRGYLAQVVAGRDRTERWAILKAGLTSEMAKFLPVDAAFNPPSEAFSAAAAQISDSKDPLDWAARMDLLTYLPDDLMVKADRASMDVGLELREPLLNSAFVKWGLALPIAARFDFGSRQGKQPARRYLATRLPPELLKREKKGFTPPLGLWLKGALERRKLEAIDGLCSGRLSPMCLPEPCTNWADCAKRLDDRHQQFLWRVVCFSGWLASAKEVSKTSTLLPGHRSELVIQSSQ